ncbi:MAG: D-amino acid aminotransferase [Verrucomicrobiae bacterium]|nr:D-amino acid aminotransferase [Verrucomicrobiae bacterium]
MPAIAYVNGKFCPIEKAVVSVEDRGFQLGDGVYEVLRTYHGRLHAVGAHLRRLFRSLDAIELKHRFTAGGLERLLRQAVRRARFKDALVYLQVTRGAAKRMKEFPQGVSPTLVITVRPMELPPPEARQRGVRVITAKDVRWLHCDVKSICQLPNVLAANKAKAAGCYEALFIASDGTVTECASANIFMVNNGVVITPPKSANILGGITREEVIALARRHRIPLRERHITLRQLLAADEVFLTGTTAEILPVVCVDNHRIADGKPGPVTQRLYALFLRHVG